MGKLTSVTSAGRFSDGPRHLLHVCLAYAARRVIAQPAIYAPEEGRRGGREGGERFNMNCLYCLLLNTRYIVMQLYLSWS